jgi:hypothetical protein
MGHWWKDYTACVVDEWMSMEQWWNDTDRGKLKYSQTNPFRCHIVHHRCPHNGPGSNKVLRADRSATNRLNHGTTFWYPNNVDNVCTTLHCGAFAQPLLPQERYSTFPVSFAVGLNVTVSNTEVFPITTEMQQWVSFALLSSYKIFRTAVNNKYYECVSTSVS